MPRKVLSLVVLFALPLTTAGVLMAADCNDNEQDDAIDIASGASGDCNGNGVPDECDLDFQFSRIAAIPLAQSCTFYFAHPRDSAVASGDIDGDGDADLITANCGAYDVQGSTISVIRNEGPGVFGPEALIPVGSGPFSAAPADLDGDGDLDIVTANESTLSLLRNDGAGAFTPLPEYPSGGLELAAGDLDGDGDVDLVVAPYEGVEVLINSGTGEFGPVAIPASNDEGTHHLLKIALADLDRDGDLDLAGSERVRFVWKNPGNGRFDACEVYDNEDWGICWSHAIVAADLDGDSYPDVATADYTDGGTPSNSVLLNRGDGTFDPAIRYFLPDSWDENQCVAAADFDGDGDVDLISAADSTIYLFWNPGDGTFEEVESFDIDGPASVLIAPDVDGDGGPDLVVKVWGSLSYPDYDEARRLLVFEGRPSPDWNGDGVLDECEPGATLIENREEWAFFRGVAAPDPAWREMGFGEGGWERGRTGIGYGDGDDRTVLDDMEGGYLTVYARKVFEVDAPWAVASLSLEVDYDDGFIAYLNGTEVARSPSMGPAGRVFEFDEPSPGLREAGAPERFEIPGGAAILSRGPNVLAVEVHNYSLESTDLSFIPRLRCALDPAPSLAVTSAVLPIGEGADIFVLLTSEDPVQAFSLGIAHDPFVATIEAIDGFGCPRLAALNGGSGPDFLGVDLEPDSEACEGGELGDGGTAYCIASSANPETEVIPPGSGEPILHFRYVAAPRAAPGMASPLEIVGCLGDAEPWEVVLTIHEVSVTPEVSGGALTIIQDPTEFLRGDGNLDGRRDISDVVTVLVFLFGDSGPAACGDALDANDDGGIDISDAIRLLFFLFASGDPLPEPMGACGADSTADGIGCSAHPRCP
jgi:hypothetical protein